jgi:hypothetical protein
MAADNPPKTCSRCGNAPAGPGGILCPACVKLIEASRPWPIRTDPDIPETSPTE